jgi:hypothetical protein
MISVDPRLLLIASLAVTLFSGCSGIAGNKNITETELEITPTESVASFSRSSQFEIASLALSPDQLGSPTSLESLPSLATLTPSGRRSLLVSEAWHLRGQNDVEVPIATSLERYLRAAHFAYEGIFAGDACSDPHSQLCKELYAAYNCSTREVARLTNNGGDLRATGGSAYLVDLDGDGDPLTLQEWEITLEDYTSVQAQPALGVSGAACQVVRGEGASAESAARRCAPISFLVLFDERTEDTRSRAHVVAYDTFEHGALALHGRDVALQTSSLTAWSQIFTPPSSPFLGLSCLSGVVAPLPTVVFMTAPGLPSPEWAVIASTLSTDHHLADHYNFCTTPSLAATGINQPADTLTVPLRLLAPQATPPLQVILVSEGADNEQFVRTLKQSMKDAREEHVHAPLVLAGSLVLTTAHQAASSEPHSLPATPSEISRQGTVALRDVQRLLSKLSDPEEGVFGPITRSHIPHGPGETLSPVM